MEQPQYLMDTNVVIDYLGNKLPASGMELMNDIVNNIPQISIITKIELLSFNTSDEHYSILTDFTNDSHVVELSDSVVDFSIEIRKKHKTKLPDAIIAATAFVNGLVLLSRNYSDFKNIEGLKVIDLHKI